MNGNATTKSSSFPTSFRENPSQVEEIALLCVSRELNQPDPYSNADGSEIQLDEILVMEMACYLYLGQINNAWHLWRRTLPSSNGKNYRSESLEKIWGVGSAMLGHDSIKAITCLKELTTSPPAPLSPTIITELLDKYRERISDNLSSGYMKLNVDCAAEKLGFENLPDTVDYLEKRGWTSQGIFLTPPRRTMGGEMEVKGVEKMAMLTDIVSFMEKDRMNA
mmetsp:Transcript_2293/g.2963  ORF Transcript_2293/g.2963 Transcript_2293/m.2963 type:complete len:222 (-) Transcript_2293:125-790(-)|eukprot:CAMPEP_0172516716 /NCGR_PEP_ID=MMETSP1066-20121228/278473_1 /TAXON_ID=671091 /ORGANISM="Coscinodiscus wailesii, Strain CCMP2513" /LENGTH=221 /DNA_ID=CAMNT_0013298313 /DNA_START=84 /DNA_END=749 /DNA_ORIENTATION=+